MFGTLKAMKAVVMPETKRLSLEALCAEYQQSQRGDILATMYEKVFSAALGIRNKYPIVEDEICATALLEVLHDLMLMYDTTKNVKFITLFYTGFARKMYAESKPFTRKKRIPTAPSVSLTENRFTGGNAYSSDYELWMNWIEDEHQTNELETVVILDLIQSLNLTKRQLQIVEWMDAGFTATQMKEMFEDDDVKTVLSDIRKIRQIFKQAGIEPKKKDKQSKEAIA